MTTMNDEQQRYCERFAELIVTGLTSYAGAIRWLEFFMSNPDDKQAIEELHLYGRNVGVEMIGFIRLFMATREKWDVNAPTHPGPILPLARALGDSYTILLLVKPGEKQSAENLPLVPMDETVELFTPEAERWLAQWVDEVPKPSMAR
jgi:hypothetical protein